VELGKGYNRKPGIPVAIRLIQSKRDLPLERLPYRATAQSAAYDRIVRLPVCVLLDNVRSLYNVGAFFRTADAAGIEKLYLSGITGAPPKKAISKTALGAEETVAWEHTWEPLPLLGELHSRGVEIAAVETTPNSVDLFEWAPRFPVCVIFGHEVDGLRPEVGAMADVHIRIPMLGRKHSLNVATAGGIVMYELLRKYVQACGPRITSTEHSA
jgi:23S rRNA (guanosine2251-2'-O)-methyltransferase